MKRTLSDIFKREYEVRLSVSARDTVSPQSEQLRGAAILAPEGDEVFRRQDLSGVEKTFALLRELRPDVLRVEAWSPDFVRWMDLCRDEEISPHLVFSASALPGELEAAAADCASRFRGNELWTPVRFYEISCDPDILPFEDDDTMKTLAESMKTGAECLRRADPEAKIILGGIFPSEDCRGKADLWNRTLLETCGTVMDMIGVQIFPSCPPEIDEDEEGVEADWALAEGVRKGLRDLDRLLSETAADHAIRTAVTGWGLRKEGRAQKRQDCVFWSSVCSALMTAVGSVGLHECGPLFGSSGLLTADGGEVFGNIFYRNMLTAARDLEIRLRVKEAESGKGIPVYRWDGIPGVFEGGEIPLLEVIASRSPDGKRLFLFMTNRSPFRMAVPRIRFYDMPVMHPVKAFILRSKKRTDENSASAPENVYCKEVKLRNYRKMDHVTPEIPECSTACMILE